ncbi:hypothetical protein K2X85_01690 [bacterium]|nr:hypothetical protein [bacterium]
MDRATLLLAQTLSLAAAGLFSWSMINLVVQDTLKFYLADSKFQLLVLAGGVLLGLIVLLRLPSLFTGTSHHHHDHEHAGDDHGHDHDEHTHAPSLWRLIILALPIMIIFMGVPPSQLSAQGLTNKLSAKDLKALADLGNASMPPGFEPKGDVVDADWKVLVAAADDPFKRERWQAQAVRIAGQAVPDRGFADRYRLMRVKITCCAADAVPLSITVLGKPNDAWKPAEWIEVTGAVNFVPIQSSTGERAFLPVVYQVSADTTVPRPYLQ